MGTIAVCMVLCWSLAPNHALPGSMLDYWVSEECSGVNAAISEPGKMMDHSRHLQLLHPDPGLNWLQLIMKLVVSSAANQLVRVNPATSPLHNRCQRIFTVICFTIFGGIHHAEAVFLDINRCHHRILLCSTKCQWHLYCTTCTAAVIIC